MAETTAPAAPLSSYAADWVPVVDLHPWAMNPRKHKVEEIAKSMLRFGYGAPAVGSLETREIIAGHGRIKSANLIREWGKAGRLMFPGDPPRSDDVLIVTSAAAADIHRIVERGEVPCRFLPLSLGEAHALALADNQLGGVWDDPALGLVIRELREQNVDLSGLGWTEAQLGELLAPDGGAKKGPSLLERFLVPPFTVLDARQGYWKERKRQWIALGIKSELGRLTLGPRAETGAHGVYVTGGNREERGWDRPPGMATKAKNLALRTLGKDGSAHFERKAAGDQALHRAPGSSQAVEGHIFRSDSGRDPDYYHQKRSVEARLGREISTEEFQAQYYVNEQDGSGLSASGTSVFDPVLCELVYRWFSPRDGRVLDPFAGGSVRGVVAGKLGRTYVGIDLSADQVAANEQQADALFSGATASPAPAPAAAPLEARETMADFEAKTPVQRHGDILLKRDDLLALGAANGGKLRCAMHAALKAKAKGLVSAGSRQSTGGIAMAAVASKLGIPCEFHVPDGGETPELTATAQLGAAVVRHPAGRNSVLRARARDSAAAKGWYLIPFGMECPEMVEATAPQVSNLPWGEFDRLVVPVGGGMSLAGILWGLHYAKQSVPVVGVRVGSRETEKRLKSFGPPDWKDRLTFEAAPHAYDEPAPVVRLGPVRLDSIYEAKTIPFLRPRDLLWVVSIRASEVS